MIELRAYQQAAIDGIYEWFAANTGNPLVVAPTASGKSVMIAEFTRRACTEYPATRVLILTHVRELIAQNAQRLNALWPEGNVGIYSAGLNRRDLGNQVTFASIQSVHKRAMQLGRYDLILIDEAHLIPPRGEGMYRSFLDASRRINPKIKIVGFTATPYRLRQGMLYEGEHALFDGIAHDITIRELLDAGYLAPLTTEPVRTRTDTEGVGLRQGEYITSQLAQAVDVDALTQAATGEIVSLGADRAAWLVFCVTIRHAENVCGALRNHGITSAIVTGKTPKRERERLLSEYKAGRIRALVNVDVLTTGFDYPGIDLIAFLRPTLSPGLYLQMCGRGMRIAPAKHDCVVLDFAGNIERHGPVDDVRPPQAPKPAVGGGGGGLKECDRCHEWVGTANAICPRCGFRFPMAPAHAGHASAADILSNGRPPEPKAVMVTHTTYTRHTKPGKPPSLRVDYYGGMNRIASEWVCLEHGGFAQTKARLWWNRRCGEYGKRPPDSVAEALERLDELRQVEKVLVRKSGKYLEVIGVEYKQSEAA